MTFVSAIRALRAGGGVRRLRPLGLRRPRFAFAALGMAAALALASAAPAFAAPVGEFEYLVMRSTYNQNGSRRTVVAAEIPQSVQLPAEVRLNVPRGAQIAWVGEILGGDASQDPKAEYTTVAGKDFDTLVMTLKTARRAQAEFSLPAAETREGALAAVKLDLVAPAAAKAGSVEVEVPKGATTSGLSDGVTRLSANQGYDLYGRQYTSIRAGDRLSVTVRYQPVTGTQGQPAPGQGGSATPPAAGGRSAFPSPGALIFLALLVFLTLAILKRMEAARTAMEPAAKPSRSHDAGRHASQPSARGDDRRD